MLEVLIKNKAASVQADAEDDIIADQAVVVLEDKGNAFLELCDPFESFGLPLSILQPVNPCNIFIFGVKGHHLVHVMLNQLQSCIVAHCSLTIDF